MYRSRSTRSIVYITFAGGLARRSSCRAVDITSRRLNVQHFGVLGVSESEKGHRMIAIRHAVERLCLRYGCCLQERKRKGVNQHENYRKQEIQEDKADDMVGELQAATT